MPDNIRQAIVWFIFIFSSFMLYNQWRVYNGDSPLFGPNEAVQVQNNVDDPNQIGVPSTSGLTHTDGVNGATVSTPTNAHAVRGEDIVITTDLFRVTFNSTGGKITEIALLKQYANEGDTQPVILVNPAYNYELRTGLVDTQGGLLPNHNTNMHFRSAQRSMQEGQDHLDVVFESDPINGVQLNKTYRFTRDSYLIDVTSEIVNIGSETVTPEIYYQIVRNSDNLPGASSWFGGSTYTGMAYYNSEERYNKVSFSDIDKKALKLVENNGWIAMVQHYFVSSWVLDDGIQREFFTRKLNGNNYEIGMIASVPTLNPGEKISQTAHLYSGPQYEKVLENIAPGLELVKDYGIFRMFSKPLFWLLYFFHEYLHNWGWSIVALVVAIKIAFFWLNAKAYQSMAKMRALSPRLQEINERYKDDPRKKQEETMRIYKQEKINPLGGCLPILIQIPVFIALYWVLLSSVEMRHAPWIGWITDLSAKDPYYILPLIMAASTMLQTWLNPKPADPMQAKMMWMMPLMFSVMFFFFPSGLVLYWVTNNILSIAQQWFINKKMIPKSQKT